jgi:hypothetical protein
MVSGRVPNTVNIFNVIFSLQLLLVTLTAFFEKDSGFSEKLFYFIDFLMLPDLTGF